MLDVSAVSASSAANSIRERPVSGKRLADRSQSPLCAAACGHPLPVTGRS